MGADFVESPPPSAGAPSNVGLEGRVEEQLGIRSLIREYLIPVETNSIWYLLGGVLAISLVLEIFTGMLLTFVYVPDAGKAYDITKDLINSPGWHVILNFHYWTAFLIFALVLIHMLRVFITGGYRRGKQGLWLIGVVLAGLTFLLSVTGETLHWDEVGFAVPWHVSEVYQAFGLAGTFDYTFADLRNVSTATPKLVQFYGVHLAVAAILLVVFIIWHYYLIRLKGISLPFWLRASGRKVAFSEHVRGWLIYSGIILGVILLVSIFVPRDAGTVPQLLPSSPFFGSPHGPGFLGTKPSFPISWTHGMNVFVGEHLGVEPDIWGSIFGMTLLTLALVAIPFLDRGDAEPASRAEAFNLRKRGWAFAAMGLFW
ncbi:MAG TPA: cytochrome b N-terminal domain-containing protein, partial [Ktedonobacteraceae bacterium]